MLLENYEILIIHLNINDKSNFNFNYKFQIYINYKKYAEKYIKNLTKIKLFI